jgi:hypothetical protein
LVITPASLTNALLLLQLAQVKQAIMLLIQHNYVSVYMHKVSSTTYFANDMDSHAPIACAHNPAEGFDCPGRCSLPLRTLEEELLEVHI